MKDLFNKKKVAYLQSIIEKQDKSYRQLEQKFIINDKDSNEIFKKSFEWRQKYEAEVKKIDNILDMLHKSDDLVRGLIVKETKLKKELKTAQTEIERQDKIIQDLRKTIVGLEKELKAGFKKELIAEKLKYYKSILGMTIVKREKP